MIWRVVTIGKPALAHAKAGVVEYSRRISRYTHLQLVHGKERGQEENSRQLLELSKESSIRIALDERGRELTTARLVQQINAWEQNGTIKSAALLIGGADGHNDELRSAATDIWRLSALTLQHELALVILLEALYRAYTIKRGEPYHR
jgi:23S rRNA (pseudouridine1915-N3)-methyltransferase